MFSTFFKHNSLLLTFLVLYLLTVAMTAIVIDKQYYQDAKREIISDNSWELIQSPVGPSGLDPLMQKAEAALQGGPKDIQDLRQQILEIINDEQTLIWRIDLRRLQPGGQGGGEGTDGSETSIYNQAKLRTNNTFANSLFLRNFSRKVNNNLGPRDRPIGTLVCYYTTPLENAQINELTTKYRLYTVAIWLIVTALFVIVARVVLLPLRNVTISLERSTRERTHFVTRPRTPLETLYNRMALEAVFARLQGQLREQIAERPQMTGWEAVVFVCESFAAQIEMPLIACLELVAEGPGSLKPTGHATVQGRIRPAMNEADRAALAAALDRSLPRDNRPRQRFTVDAGAHRFSGVLQLLTDPERTGIRYLFALTLDARSDEASFVSMQSVLEQLTDLVDAGLQTLNLRNQLLVQERGRANISLSRNLGHDLTNIIGASKLELMALDRLLRAGKLPEDDRRRAILFESLQGLLKSVKFMQELVNLYRAYAFLQHPVLEVQDGNLLIGETMDLFQMSISAKIEVHRELAEDAPRCFVDPRLIKLALFNMFTNSLEAIRKVDPDRTSQGWLRVITRRGVEGGLVVAIEDSGIGILNAQGQRAQPHEIEKIFELGYTTARVGGSHGEGLGLNWVRTIVQDLHGGTIFAENSETGGARFVLSFPSLEAAPKLENAEMVAREYMRRLQMPGEEEEPS